MDNFFTSTKKTSEIQIQRGQPFYSDVFSRDNAFSRMSHNCFRSPQNTITIPDPDIYEIDIKL